MRLIDADNLIPIMKYNTTDNEIGVFPIRIGFNTIKRVIDEAPTIDAVEVVRCKDCKHYSVKGKTTQWLACESVMEGQATDPDGYCYLGRRREESEVEE